jgi:hypothetical protein
MSRVLVLNKSRASFNQAQTRRNSASLSGASLVIAKKVNAGKAQINLISLMFFLVVSACICGAGYLYQVNDIATKGYEIRELENEIQGLNKESKKMEIREVELRSMYNIEKSSQDLNLVNSGEVTYVEINGPVAMK